MGWKRIRLQDGGIEDPVADGRAVLVDLVRKREAAAQRGEEISAERARLAFAAAADEDPEAAQQLAALTREALGQRLALENLDHAIREARERLAGAEAAEQHRHAIANAHWARELTGAVLEAGTDIEKAAEQLVVRLRDLMALFQQLQGLGVGAPSRPLVAANVQRRLQIALRGTGLVVGDPVPRDAPFQTITELLGSYAARINSRADRIEHIEPEVPAVAAE